MMPVSTTWSPPAWRDFSARSRSRNGHPPDAVSLYAYDAACLVLAAIERVGLNRARIRDALADTDHEGVAGRFRFDGLGGTSLEPVLLTPRGEAWGPVEENGRSRAVGLAD